MKRHPTAARAILTVLLCAGADAVMYACPICFQIEDAQAVSGVRAAVAVLMGVTGVVLAGFAVFAGRLVKSSREPPPSPEASASVQAAADKSADKPEP